MLGLLAELQRIVVQTFGFITGFLLQAQPLTADRVQVLEGLLTGCFVLVHVLLFAFHSLLIQLLATLQTFLLKLLPACGVLLLEFGQLALNLLLQGRALLTGGLQQFFALLAGLFPQLVDLAFRFLADRCVVHQLVRVAAWPAARFHRPADAR